MSEGGVVDALGKSGLFGGRVDGTEGFVGGVEINVAC